MQDENDIEEEYVSKSAKKREMAAAQDLALKLLEMNPTEFNNITLEPQVVDAIEATKKIKSQSARRRQLRQLGQVISNTGPEKVKALLTAIIEHKNAANGRFHELEDLRDGVVGGENEAIQQVLERFPNGDRQHLRNLQRNAQKEKTEAGTARVARIIFQYLRELSSDDPEV